MIAKKIFKLNFKINFLDHLSGYDITRKLNDI